MSELRIRQEVAYANRQLAEKGLVIQTWGNASAIDRPSDILYIKPSGVAFSSLEPEEIVKVHRDRAEGDLKPSVDTPIHREIYDGFPEVGGIVHTHSPYATAFAQAGLAIPCLGTTQADYFYGKIPLTRELTEEEIKTDYETSTGRVIVGHFKVNSLDPLDMPAVLVPSHGAFTWGSTVGEAVERAVVLEEIAKMAYRTMTLKSDVGPINNALLEKHHQRIRGEKKYYGQGD